MKTAVMPTFKLHCTNYFVPVSQFGHLHVFVSKCSIQARLVIGNWCVTKPHVYLVSVFRRIFSGLNLRYHGPNLVVSQEAFMFNFAQSR